MSSLYRLASTNNSNESVPRSTCSSGSCPSHYQSLRGDFEDSALGLPPFDNEVEEVLAYGRMDAELGTIVPPLPGQGPYPTERMIREVGGPPFPAFD